MDGLAIFDLFDTYGDIMLECAIQHRSSVASTIGTRLKMISQPYRHGPPNTTLWLDPVVEEASQQLLVDLLCICTWPTPVKQPTISKRIAHEKLNQLLRQHRRYPRRLGYSITGYAENACSQVACFSSQCERILKLTNHSQATPTRDARATGPQDFPTHVNRALLEALELLSACDPCRAHSVAPKGRHYTRVHLGHILQVQEDRAVFDIIVSSLQITCWQEYCLGIPLRTPGARGHVRVHGDSKNTRREYYEKLRSGKICDILDTRQHIYTRLRLLYCHGDGLAFLQDSEALRRFVLQNEGVRLSQVLEDYRLTTQDKITLAHAISHTCWLLYCSELWRQKWTSQNIWFMQEEDTDRRAKADLPLKAYISFDPDTSDPETADFLDTQGVILSHRMPRILALGLLLVEIGLGRPLKTRRASDIFGQINADHSSAIGALEELRATKWEDISAESNLKTTLETSIHNCLCYKTFVPPPAPHSEAASQSSPVVGSGSSYDTLERRRLLYEKVVEPLAHLTETAFLKSKDHSGVDYLVRRVEGREVSLYDTCGSNSEILNLPATFHSGRPMIAKEWLDNLRVISSHVAKIERHPDAKGKRRIRIAILDTGYNSTVPFFKDRRRSERIRAWEDFACRSLSPVDTYGHGTFMTRLVMESAPLADIYIARVAQATHELDSSRANIVEAIHWAEKHEVDIVSMSFGFKDDSDDISAAIEKVQRNREQAVILIASAGNSGPYQEETFPARHKSVISVYAANCNGVLLPSRPLPSDPDNSCILGTFGDDVPSVIHDELKPFCHNGVLEPGSSVATAIAAGIAATMLSYATVLPYILAMGNSTPLLQKLKTISGMTKMLKRMSPPGRPHYFVNPVWFWSTMKSNLDVYCALHDCTLA